MNNEQLQQAYQLIQAGEKEQAIALLEPLIRADRENDDAWWLLANATDDTDAKRNALTNVIRLTNIDSRREQAQQLLNTLDSDPFAFDFGDETPASDSTPSYTAVDEMPKQASRGGLNCGTLVLGIIGLLGLCMCAGGVLIFTTMGDILEMGALPDDTVILSDVAVENSISGVLNETDSTDAYRFTPETTGTYRITVDSEAALQPYIFIYYEDTGIFAGASAAQVTAAASVANIALDGEQDYVVITRGFSIWGEEIGYGDYELTIEARD
ncbi:MAG: hypothetical protein AAFR81_05370 [Chloroflexota bacterium]